MRGTCHFVPDSPLSLARGQRGRPRRWVSTSRQAEARTAACNDRTNDGVGRAARGRKRRETVLEI